MAKERGLTGFSTLKKQELIDLLKINDDEKGMKPPPL
jgi:hypothetical protein